MRSDKLESLKEIIEIVKQLEQTSSTNGKEFILKKNKDNKLLKKTLFFTYCKDYQYGIKKTTINKMRFDIDDSNKWNNNIFKMLEELANSNINNELTREVQGLLTFYEKDIRELIIRILLKDLRIGVNVKTINKAISGLIPKHEIMLASKFEGKLKGKVSMSLKMDGIRCSILIDEEGNTKYLSRQGVRINGLKELDKEVRALGLTNTFVDGELIMKNINNLSSDDNFRLTTKVVNSNSEDKRGLEFVVFDMTSLKEYQEGKSNTPY
jgi:DNA ligase-1